MEKPNIGLEDLKQIRSIMEKSSTFLSLSGFSGVIVGFIALAAGVAIGASLKTILVTSEALKTAAENAGLRGNILAVFIAAFLVAVVAAYLFSLKKAKNKGLPIFNRISLHFASHLFMPLLAGGVFVIVLASKGYFDLVLPSMLIFYGLSLVSASKYTHPEIAYLGMTVAALGLLAVLFIQYSLLLWAAGFGVCTIGYGLFLYTKYEK
jgi:hypothetical protein